MTKDSSQRSPLSIDEHYMKMALTLAKKGKGKTRPNPMVGTVIVKNNQVIAKGYHHKAGADHAETDALKKAGNLARGATLYVNLEPCSHTGQTPPCVDVLIEHKITRVVIAMTDPNPLVNGKGVAILEQAGIAVTTGILEKEAQQLNEVFIKYITTGLPFVILKSDISLDGKTATKHGDVHQLSTLPCQRELHNLRNNIDAILVESGIIIQNNPLLTVRLVKQKNTCPTKIIIDNLLKTPLRSKIFSKESPAENIIITTDNASIQKKESLKQAGATVWEVGSYGRNKVNLHSLLHRLGEEGISSIMIEGGTDLSAAALIEGIVDKVVFFIAPLIIGGKEAPSPIGGEGTPFISNSIKIRDMQVTNLKEGLMVEGYVNKQQGMIQN